MSQITNSFSTTGPADGIESQTQDETQWPLATTSKVAELKRKTTGGESSSSKKKKVKVSVVGELDLAE